MAYDKIIPVRARLDHCADYVLNPEKTSLPDGGPRLATAINCQLDTAYRDMMDTKRRWGKSGGVQGYHIIHSYTPGEVTPMEAHEMGVELAQRLLGDKYEAIVSTHLDHDHLHCHILFNSVGFMDGAKFRNTFQDYYRDIRGISNEVSRAHGVSVIEPEAKGEHYAEWSAGQSGKATVRGLIRQDMDAAINSAFTYQTFWEQLARMGYTIKRGPNVKHTAVRPPGGARFIRLASLGDGYTEDAIKERLAGVRSGISTAQSPPPKPPRRYTVKRGPLPRRPRQKLKGFRALYVHYLYLLGIRRPSPKRPPLPFSVRKEVTRLNRYVAQFRFLQANRVDNAAQLAMLGDALQAEIDALTDQRKDLYRRKRRGQDVDGEIQAITQKLRPLRQKLKTCGQIEQSVQHIRSQTELCRDAQRKEQEHQKAITKTCQARPQKFSPPDR
ncbi:relaxase/mobilization nuclease domain-containing protein [Oscillibacter valericigenes]|uniref:relaxase/mobilization nuclease domain-containing protein n=1 Tax=Oscillibacter valericigenes TaxID=351091 RepID=UPI00195C30F2|nr:relaxase/mobilization nuclease domain-containing protein [Oscillibacter valericigenes]